VERSGAKAGTAVILDPHSGEILALANQPTFDPNQYKKASSAAKRNRATADYLEPGSIFKVILAAGALEEGAILPTDQFHGENGSIAVGGVTIRDHEKYGWLTVRQIMAQSSNVGAIKIGQKLGKSLYYHYMSAFGFGSLTGVDLPGETPGLMRRPKGWSALSLPALSLGHEVSVTPIQFATAFAAVANGGNLMRPYVIRSLRTPDGTQARDTGPVVVRRVISESTAHTLLEILTSVVEEGTGKDAAVPGYAVAGKTGTAQKVDPATGRYSHRKVVASFVGAVPAEAPRLVILVMIDEPETLRWGGSIAAPTFREIARDALKYLRVPPSPPRDVRLVRAG
jgi:cell division protein FtsI (penicillin-binding protein 3)